MTSLDTSPQARLRALAASMSLTDNDVATAWAKSGGSEVRAEIILYQRAPRPRSPPAAADRMKKAASALAKQPEALAILRVSLTKCLNEPHNEKFRKVNVAQGIFKERVVAKTGMAGMQLLYAVGYEPMHGYLVLQNHNPALLKAAIDTLDQAKETDVYREAKAALDGETARQSAAARDEEAARARRASYLAKVPAEPSKEDGACSSACVITISVGEDKVGTKRTFDADNTLGDLENYVRSLESVPEGALKIENVTTRPPRVFDLHGDERKASLYSLDLWPVSRVRVTRAAA